MIEIVASNVLILERAQRFRELLNVGHSLHLFKNPFQPKPQSKLSEFSESIFPGYLIINLDGKFGAPKKVKDGEYQSESLSLTFTCTGPTNEVCYGWLIRDNFNVKLSHKFFVPVPLGTGKVITFKVDAQVWATSILT